MDQEWIVRRRRIGQEELLLIRGLLPTEGHLGRSHISNRLCEIWDWRQANGQFRQIACRELLRRLEAKGLVSLPPMLCPARRKGYKNAVTPGDLLERVPLRGSLDDLRHEIQVNLIQGGPEARLFKGLMGNFHYLGYQQAQGAQVKYLAQYRDRPVACLSFGPAAFRVAARDRFIGWSSEQRQEGLPRVVNNDRFLILPWVEVPHLASFVLSRCLRRLRPTASAFLNAEAVRSNQQRWSNSSNDTYGASIHRAISRRNTDLIPLPPGAAVASGVRG